MEKMSLNEIVEYLIPDYITNVESCLGKERAEIEKAAIRAFLEEMYRNNYRLYQCEGER